MKNLRVFAIIALSLSFSGCASAEEGKMKEVVERFISVNDDSIMKYNGRTVIKSAKVIECRKVAENKGVCLVEFDHISQGKFTREWDVRKTEFGDWKTSG